MTARPTGETGVQAEPALQPEVLKGLHEIAVAAGGATDPAEVANIAVAAIQRLLQADMVGLRLYDARSDRLKLLSAAGDEEGRETEIKTSEGAAGQAYNTRKPVLAEAQARPSIAVPLLLREQPIGTLEAFRCGKRRFTAGEQEVLSLFAAQVAPLLETARLAAQREAQVNKFRALHDLAVAASGVLHMGALARLTAGHARAMLNADGAILCTWNQDAGRLQLAAYEGVDRAEAKVEYEPGEGAIGLAYKQRRPMVIDDYQDWPQAVSPYIELGTASTVAVPLIAHDVAIGSLAVWTRDRRHFDDDVQLLTLLAAQLSPSLEAARLYAESDRQRAEAEALAQLMRQGAGEPDVDRAINLIANRASLLLGADYCAIALFRDGELRWEGMWGNQTDFWRQGAPTPGGAVQNAIRRGETVILERSEE